MSRPSARRSYDAWIETRSCAFDPSAATKQTATTAPTKPKPARHPHIAFDVDHDALDRWIERLAAAGIRVDGPRRLGPPGHASVYFCDPFGNLLELATMGYRGTVAMGPPDLDAIA
jgi:catechol 2,3-dioxygenase-like lactoylglutathione lyase family enzyme